MPSDEMVEVAIRVGPVPRAVLACYWRWKQDECNKCLHWAGVRSRCKLGRPPCTRYMDRMMHAEAEVIGNILGLPHGRKRRKTAKPPLDKSNPPLPG